MTCKSGNRFSSFFSLTLCIQYNTKKLLLFYQFCPQFSSDILRTTKTQGVLGFYFGFKKNYYTKHNWASTKNFWDLPE